MTDTDRIEILERRIDALEGHIRTMADALRVLDMTAATITTGLKRLAEFQGLTIRLRPTQPGEQADFIVETARPAAGGVQ